MILISSVLGSVVTTLLTNSVTVAEFLYCSNVSAMDDYNIPLQKGLPVLDSSTIPNAATPSMTQANFYPPPGPTSLKSFTPLTSSLSCSHWFGLSYPFSEPYERNPNASNPLLTKSCTFKPNPKGGWLASSNVTMTSLVLSQVYSWSYYAIQNFSNIGEKPESPTLSSFRDLTSSSLNSSSSNDGFLGSIPDLFYLFPNGSLKQMPFYVQVSGTQTDMDDRISQTVRSLIASLAKVDKSAILNVGASAAVKANYSNLVSQITVQMPIGAIIFQNMDPVQGEFDVILQVGSDSRLSRAATYPLQGIRLLIQYTQLVSGIVGNSLSQLQLKITAGLRHMPYIHNNAFPISVGSLIGNYVYPFGLSFMLPTFMMTIVKEKEERVLVMMQMNGLKISYYYLAHYIHFYILHILTTTVFIISGIVAQMEFFTQTNPMVYLILFFFWGHAQIAVAFFLSVFFSKSRTALVAGVVIMLSSVIVNNALCTAQYSRNQRNQESILMGFFVVQILGSDRASVGFTLWPPFAFYRALDVVNKASYISGARPYNIRMFTKQDEVTGCVIALVLETFVYLFIAWYLNNVLKSEFGIRKPWHFVISEYWKRPLKTEYGWTAKKDTNESVLAFSEELQGEDQDVKMERKKVLSNLYNPKCPLIMKGMRKVYGDGNKIAVRDVTFAVEPDSIFGLLGPNGAGKTTLMSILAGIYPPSSGTAFLAGFNINTEMDKVYRSMGICPQHDILWDDLTAEEHLLFYARLKGIDKHHEQDAVKKALKSVALDPFAHRITRGMSGGEKRRLSIAISLIGNPKVVFLDEPTTGLDPEVRRLIWNIINKAREGRTIVLTTHSMEEAEAICQRIGIMAKGYLRCIESQVKLKERYGNGFKINISCNPKDHDKAATFIESLLPPGWEPLDCFEGNISYEFTQRKGLPALFENVEKGKAQHGILDWGLSQTTLEEVFLKIVSDSEADSA